MLFKLEITHIKKKFKIFCFCGDHSFLQDVFNLPKSFKGEGGSCCRTCLIKGRNFKNILKSEEANKIDILRKERFSSALEYPLNEYSNSFYDILEGILGNVIFVIVQKMIFYDNNYQRLPNVKMNWNPVESEIRKFNKNDRSQKISLIITDGFFSRYTFQDNIEKKNI